jgi:ferrochelatase
MNGLLMMNLGTPTAPTTGAVRTFLREFLSDPRVLDINPVLRAGLLYGIILPFRSPKSAAAYAKVWMEEGSPLLVHSQRLTAAVEQELGQDWKVALGMRYGQPSMASALDSLVQAGVDRIAVMPMYPQYATSSTGSMVDKIYTEATRYEVSPRLAVAGDFYSDSRFLDPSAAAVDARVRAFEPDHVLFSFHGLPERQIRRTAPDAERCRFSGDCCDTIDSGNRHCYRAQSHHTARAIAERINLEPANWSISFQSRLGRAPWIKPWTDEILPALAAQGIRRLLVSCPSFTVDCLETLEEIGIRSKAAFIAAGGEDLDLVPCLNDDPVWARGVASMARALIDGRSQ